MFKEREPEMGGRLKVESGWKASVAVVDKMDWEQPESENEDE